MILTNVWGVKSRQVQEQNPLFASCPLSGTRTPFSVGRETAPGTDT
jgi:hypothetical protein